MKYSLNRLYKTVGISKQAVVQYSKRQQVFDEKMAQVVLEAEILKEEHPGCGVEKMYYTLQPDFIGRDRFIDSFMGLGFRVKRKKNYKKTTYSSKRFFPNLIKGMAVDRPSQIWQSDITYIKVGAKYCYAVFIIDVYTKQIVGHQLSNHMRATANIKALKMALKKHKAPKVHHSDRGSQYTSLEYLGILKDNKCKISMANKALDNPYAERINKTIKEEYLDYWDINEYDQLKRALDKAVRNYNNKRLHNHLKRKTPVNFTKQWNALKKKDRPKFNIFNDQTN